MSVARQYYHARKRSDETALEYLYRLNVAAIRAKIDIREGKLATRREHVEHFISTLDDRDLAKQLTLLRLTDADGMEETLRAYERMEARQKKAPMGSSKFHQRSATHTNPGQSKSARVVRTIRAESESSDSELESSESDDSSDPRRVCVTTASDQVKSDQDRRVQKDVDRGGCVIASSDQERAHTVDRPDTMIAVARKG